MNEEKLRTTLSNLMKGVLAKGMLVKRGGGEHNTHRWINVRKPSSSIVKAAEVKMEKPCRTCGVPTTSRFGLCDDCLEKAKPPKLQKMSGVGEPRYQGTMPAEKELLVKELIVKSRRFPNPYGSGYEPRRPDMPPGGAMSDDEYQKVKGVVSHENYPEGVQAAIHTKQALKKEEGGSPATVSSMGFTPTFGGQSRSVRRRVAAQKGLPAPDFEDENQGRHGEKPKKYSEDDPREDR